MIWQGLVAVLVLTLAATVLFADVNSPKITTDGSVDCSTTQAIVRDVCRGKTTDRDKTLASLQEIAKEKTHTKKVTENPTRYTIDVAGEELPRMLRLEMSVEP